jgi:hypothetical protein
LRGKGARISATAPAHEAFAVVGSAGDLDDWACAGLQRLGRGQVLAVGRKFVEHLADQVVHHGPDNRNVLVRIEVEPAVGRIHHEKSA